MNRVVVVLILSALENGQRILSLANGELSNWFAGPDQCQASRAWPINETRLVTPSPAPPMMNTTVRLMSAITPASAKDNGSSTDAPNIIKPITRPNTRLSVSDCNIERIVRFARPPPMPIRPRMMPATSTWGAQPNAASPKPARKVEAITSLPRRRMFIEPAVTIPMSIPPPSADSIHPNAVASPWAVKRVLAITASPTAEGPTNENSMTETKNSSSRINGCFHAYRKPSLIDESNP